MGFVYANFKKIPLVFHQRKTSAKVPANQLFGRLARERPRSHGQARLTELLRSFKCECDALTSHALASKFAGDKYFVEVNLVIPKRIERQIRDFLVIAKNAVALPPFTCRIGSGAAAQFI